MSQIEPGVEMAKSVFAEGFIAPEDVDIEPNIDGKVNKHSRAIHDPIFIAIAVLMLLSFLVTVILMGIAINKYQGGSKGGFWCLFALNIVLLFVTLMAAFSLPQSFVVPVCVIIQLGAVLLVYYLIRRNTPIPAFMSEEIEFPSTGEVTASLYTSIVTTVLGILMTLYTYYRYYS